MEKPRLREVIYLIAELGNSKLMPYIWQESDIAHM